MGEGCREGGTGQERQECRMRVASSPCPCCTYIEKLIVFVIMEKLTWYNCLAASKCKCKNSPVVTPTPVLSGHAAMQRENDKRSARPAG